MRRRFGKRRRKPEVCNHLLYLFLLAIVDLRVPILDRKGDVILFDTYLAVYRNPLDLIIYILSPPSENELMISAALTAYYDALSILLKNQVEKRAVLDNLDLVLLCLDETIDDG